VRNWRNIACHRKKTPRPRKGPSVKRRIESRGDLFENQKATEIALTIAYGVSLLRRCCFNITVASTASLRSPPAASRPMYAICVS